MKKKPIFIAIVASLLLYRLIKFLTKDESVTVTDFSEFELVPVQDAVGPESFAFDPLGEGPYTGLSDGRILKWLANESRWIDFAVTSPERGGCGGPHDHERTEHIYGRPLGLCFDQSNGDLYIADAYMDLLKVGPGGGLTTKVATRVNGIPLAFANSLDIDPRTGSIYFTDSSSIYQRRNYISVIISGDRTGRLMKYDPSTRQVTTLLHNLSFPNGVSLAKDGSYILLAETTKCRILRYWLNGSSSSSGEGENYEVFAELPGFPDNIKRSPRGGFWVGVNTRRERLAGLVTSNPWIGRVLMRLLPVDVMRAYSVWARYRGSGLAVRLGERGEILEMFEGRNVSTGIVWRSISEVDERNGVLWVGSVNTGSAGVYKI